MDRHFGDFGKRNLVRTIQGSGNGRPAFLPWLCCAVDPTQIPLSPAGQRPGGQGLWSRTTRCVRPAQPWKPRGNKKPLFLHDRLCTARVPASAQPRGRTCRWTWRESPRRGTGYPILVQWGDWRKGTLSHEFLQHLRGHGTLTTTSPFLPEALGPVFSFRGGGTGSRQPHKLRIRNLVWGRPLFLQIL